MAKPKSNEDERKVSRDRLAELLNEDLSREYQAIISYVVYSQVLKGAEFMSIAGQLEVHAQQELPSRQDAEGDAKARPNFGKSQRYAALRSRQ
jgi:hypothetical protein